jgi:hypothetical protein
MNLTIINADKAVYVDGAVLIGLDFSSVGIPDNVHALQWKVNLGWIEYIENPDFTKPANEIINELPNWANNCVTVYNTQFAAIEAAQAAMIKAAQNNQPVTTGTQTI